MQICLYLCMYAYIYTTTTYCTCKHTQLETAFLEQENEKVQLQRTYPVGRPNSLLYGLKTFKLLPKDIRPYRILSNQETTAGAA